MKTGDRLEVRRLAGTGGQPIGIGAIGIDVHIGLEKHGAPFRFRVAQLKHRLGIVKVVARKKLIEPHQILFHVPQLRVVKLFEKRRDGIRRDHRGQAGKQSRQIRAHFCQVLDGRVRGRHPHVHLQFEQVTLRVHPFVGSRAAGRWFDGGVNGNAAKQSRRIQLPRDDRNLRRRRGRRRLFRDLDFDRRRRLELGPMPLLERNPPKHDRGQHRRQQKKDEKTERPEPNFSHAGPVTSLSRRRSPSRRRSRSGPPSNPPASLCQSS